MAAPVFGITSDLTRYPAGLPHLPAARVVEGDTSGSVGFGLAIGAVRRD